MRDHSKEASKFVADRQRARWHSKALWFVREKRDKAVKELPEWERLRDSAQAIKEHTIEHLSYYLQEFERNAKSNGINIFWAKDANEHNKIVESILFQYGIKKVVKSKSMLTEECGLNSYLESRGYKVIDTDLGERIVQLAKEPPSHIVLPAIHLKKEDVSDIFHRTLNSERDINDPEYLTKVARENLRKEFLLAQAAITGVNFAMAKEGGVVVCTNEGNADLGTALPKLHIASMGIDKVIPSSRELGIFTRVLARSATGQEITTYTSHFLRPKPDGRLIVIIVDNGRSRLLKEQRELLRCIRCGACMNTCPVFRRSGGHSYQSVVPGPIGSAIESVKDSVSGASLSFACTLCGSCDNICPSQIPLHQILKDRRKYTIQAPQYHGKKKALQMLFRVLSDKKKYQSAMRIYRKVILRLPRFLIYNRFNKWGIGREMPTPAPKSFEEILKSRRGR
jgi:L-lactate dehydrogenase complex protein LldF